MQDLKVTLVQFDQVWENVEANKKKISSILKKIIETDLIVLPEMLLTSFSMNLTLAEEYKSSKSIDWLKFIAKEKNAAIYTSLMIKENNLFYNRGIFIYPSGEMITYDKRKLFSLAKEEHYFQAGKKSTLVNYKNWKFNLQICYDLRFPEISRNHLDNSKNPSYDLTLYVANWPEKRKIHWKSLLIARAIENQSYVLGVNRIGTDGNLLTYSGNSNVISPLGKELIKSPSKKQFVKTIFLNYTELNEIREKMNFLKDV